MTIPVLFGISTLMAQSLVDTWFIGRIGKEALAAFGFGFPIIMMMISVAIGLGAGRRRSLRGHSAATITTGRAACRPTA